MCFIFSGLTTESESKTRLKDGGRAKRREVMSGRERQNGCPNEVGQGGGLSTESGGQARAKSTVGLGNTLIKGKKNPNASVQGGKEERG